MTISTIYSGVETADCAHLYDSTNNISYRCFVYRNIPKNQIEATITVDGEDDQVVILDKAIIATADDDIVDCPRVLAVEGLFIAHWIDTDLNPSDDPISSVLYRAIFDTADIVTGWVNQGSVALHTTNQYDHAVVVGSSPEEFIISRRTAAGIIITARYSTPFAWGAPVWSMSDGGLTIADTVLGCYAREDDDVVLVSYQDTLTLQTYRRDADDGTGLVGPVETFADLATAGDCIFTAVAQCRVGTGQYLVVAEAVDNVDYTSGITGGTYARMVAWREVRGSTAAVLHASQWRMGLHLLSKPWEWSAADLLTTDCWVAVGFKSMSDHQEFDQMFTYIIRLDYAAIDGAAAQTVNPIPCSAIMGGSIDARPHAQSPAATDISVGKRLNHLSGIGGPPGYTLGPAGKSITFATIRFSRLIGVADQNIVELTPAQAGVGYVRFYHEDPWTIRRWEQEATQPDTPAWRGLARSPCLPIETAGGLIWTGGVTSCFDGIQPVELGFFHAPEILAAAANPAAGSIDVAGTYYYMANYIWHDNRGQVHRSPPSRPVSVVTVVNDAVTLNIRPCALSMKDDTARHPTAGPINIEIWRTTASAAGVGETTGTATLLYLFRRVFATDSGSFELQDTPISDNSVYQQAIVVGLPNTDLAVAELSPYSLNLTTLQWSPPPPTPHRALTVAASFKNRLWGIDPEDPRVIHYSEEQTPLGTQYKWHEFLDTNTFRIDGLDGEVTALQAMDDMLLVFTRSAIYRLSGTPASGGSGAQLNIQVLVNGVGCIEARSVVLTTEGVFFQSSKGIHRVSRGTGVDFPGAPVEDLINEAGNVRSAVNMENRYQVIFTLQALPGTGPLEVRPRLAIYDYRNKLWSIRPLPGFGQSSTASRLNESQHGTSWKGIQGEDLHVVLQQGGLAIERSDDDTVYSDEGAAATVAIPLDITTEWIHLSGIAGFKRLKEIGIQTIRHDAGEMTIEAWYDIDGSFDATGAAATTRVYASPADAYLRFRPDIEKLSGIKLRVYESGAVALTKNVSFVSMTIIYAGGAKLRQTALQGA